jgi:hypothetical protein
MSDHPHDPRPPVGGIPSDRSEPALHRSLRATPPNGADGASRDPGTGSETQVTEKQLAENQRDLIVELILASGAELWQDPAGDT